MEYGLTLRHIYSDVDIVELAVTATNGNYTGTTRLYIGRGQTHDWIAVLTGFPRDNHDQRKLEIGALDPGSAGGGFRALFRCVDLAGHPEVDVELWEEQEINTWTERVWLKLNSEPASIDRFLQELKNLEASLGNTAFLRG